MVVLDQLTLENTEAEIKNEQSRSSGETGDIGYTRFKTKINRTKIQHNMFGHLYTQTNTNNLNKT